MPSSSATLNDARSHLIPITGAWRPAAALAGLAALLMAPSLLLGVTDSDSLRYTYVWAQQFAAAVARGELYPRWLPESFGGLGSPAFVFYPPLAFYVDALVHGATFGLLPVERRLGVTAFMLLWLSGLGMRAWLRDQAEPRIAFWAAAAYMAAPYHLMDHYSRGALAEFSFIAMLPLLGLRAALRSWAGVPALAGGIALVTLAHLPSALLLCLMVIPIYALWQARCSRRPMTALLRSAAGGLLGLALPAVYLLPALTMQGSVSIDQLWLPFYDPIRWLLLLPMAWAGRDFMLIVAWLAAGWGVLALSVVLLLRSAGPAGRDAVLWGIVTLVCIALMAGAVPQFWTLVPFVPKVQFPWRMLGVIEFSALTAAALAVGQAEGRRLMVSAGLALALMGPAFMATGARAVTLHRDAPAFWTAFRPKGEQYMPDAAEYLPAGFPADRIATAVGRGPWTLPRGLDAMCEPAAAPCRAERTASGEIRLTLPGAGPVRVTVAQFWFPGWHGVVPGGAAVAVQPGPELRLLQLDAPAGTSELRLRRGWSSPERLGLGISVAAAAVLVLAWRRSRRAKACS